MSGRCELRLWDALFFEQCRGWTQAKVANLNCEETPQLAKWWLAGIDLGSQPLFDGMCACCATLLYGHYHHDHGACNNWKVAAPMDRFGEKLVLPDGQPDTAAQPPCFHRFSPRLFAEEAPELFEWCEATNRLSLKAGELPPWIFLDPPPSLVDCTWRYCTACYDRWANKTKTNKSFVTFRDKASQAGSGSRRRAFHACFVASE